MASGGRNFGILQFIIIWFDGMIFAFYFDKIRVIFFVRAQALTIFSIRESYHQNEKFPRGVSQKKKINKKKLIKRHQTSSQYYYRLHKYEWILYILVRFISTNANYFFQLYFIQKHISAPYLVLQFSNSRPIVTKTYLEF